MMGRPMTGLYSALLIQKQRLEKISLYIDLYAKRKHLDALDQVRPKPTCSPAIMYRQI